MAQVWRAHKGNMKEIYRRYDFAFAAVSFCLVLKCLFKIFNNNMEAEKQGPLKGKMRNVVNLPLM